MHDSAKKTGPAAEAALIAFVAAAAFFLFLFRLGGVGFFEPDEGRYSVIPAEMLRSGDFVVPRQNGVLYFEKPPLVYWMTAASFRLLGFSELAGRLPVALLGALGVVLTCLLAKRMFGTSAGLASALVLLTGLEYFFVGRILILDMPLAFFMSLSLAGFYCYADGAGRKGAWLLLFYAGLSLAVLAKGPVALALEGVIALTYLAITGRLASFVRDGRNLAGIALFSAVAVPWFVLVSSREPSFFNFFFIREHVLRFLSEEHGHGEPFYYFFMILLAGFFPWIVYLPFALKRYLSLSRARIAASSESRAFLFVFLWAAAVIGFFSFSGSKLAPYIIPAFPPMAVMVGRMIADASFNARDSGKESGAVFALLLVLAAAFILFMFRYVFGTHGLGGLKAVVTAISLVIAAGFLLSAALFFAGRRHGSFLTQALTLAAVQVLVIFGLEKCESYISSKPLIMALSEKRRLGDAVYSFGSFEQAMPFYLGERVRIVAWRGELAFGVEKLPEQERKEWFIDRSFDFLQELAQKEEKAFVVMDEDDLAAFLERFPDHEATVIAKARGAVLVTGIKKKENKT
jgi:4-amino-4-deoxy-L-arabinose transferase-like glycosyltransferase